MDKQAKIYVAGHRGLVGDAIYRHLESQGYTNIVVRRSSELDLTDQAATDAFFATEKPDYVFLAAAKVGGIMANNTYRADFIYANLQIQNNVIYSSYKHGVKKLLFLGSSCIYPKNAPQPIAEDSLLTGELEYTNEPYAIAKIAGIKMVESFNLQYGTNYLSVMPTNLYGYNDNYDLDRSHVLPALIRKTYLAKLFEENNTAAITKNLEMEGATTEQVIEALEHYGIVREGDAVTLKLWGTGTPRREFMHSEDMASACIYVMNHVNFSDLTKGQTEVKNTHINLGLGEDITIKELTEIVRDIIGFSGNITFDPSKPDGTIRKLLNVDKIHDLGWKHSVELKQGIRQTIDSYLKGLEK